MAETPQDNVPDQTAQVQPDIRAPANLAPADFGASIGQAAEEAGTRFQREEVWANQSAVMSATNKLADFTNQSVYDAKTGIAHQSLGASAPEAVNGVITDHNAKISEISDGLSNDAQRKMFAAHAAEHMRGLDRSLNNYEAGQLKQYNNEQTEAYVKNTSQSAIRAANDPPPPDGTPDPVKVRMEQVRAAIQLQGNANNQAPAFTKMQVDNAISGIHQGVVEQQISNGQLGRAQAYFDANKDEILPSEAVRLKDTLGLASDRDQSLGLARSVIMDPKTGDLRNPVDVEADVAKQTGGNARLYDETMTRVRELQTVHRVGQEAIQTQANARATDALEKANGDISKVDPNDLQIMGDPMRKALNKYAQQLTEGKFTPDNSDTTYAFNRFAAQSQTDPNATMMVNGVPTKFSDVNLLQYKPYMSDKDFSQVMGLQREAIGKKSGGGDVSGLNGATAKARIIDESLVSAGMNKPPLFDKDGKASTDPAAKSYIKFSRIVDSRVEAEGGMAKVGTQGLQRIVDDELMNQTVQQNRTGYSIFSSFPGVPTTTAESVTKRKYELTPEGTAFSIKQIPPATLEHMMQAYKGKVPSESEIVSDYNASLPSP